MWPGGTRHSASGLLVLIHTDEGVVGLGEAPGPTLPTIQTIIDAELAQFLVGDAEDDRAPVGDGHDETLVLELPERLADGPAARAELRRERRLDQAVTGLEAAGDDRSPEGLDHLLPARAGLRAGVDGRNRLDRQPQVWFGGNGHVDNLKMVDNLRLRAVVYPSR